MSEEAAKQEVTPATKTEEKQPPLKKQKVHRLYNGEWDEFAEVENPDLSKFFVAFERELRENGDIIMETEYDQDGHEVQKTVNTFDEKGNLLSHELYNEGELAEKILFEYDEKNRVTKETREFDMGYPITTTYTYDALDRIIEKRNDDSEGELQKREKFAYHEVWKDKIVKREEFDEEDKLSMTEETEFEERDGEVKTKKYIHHDHSLGVYRRTEFYDPKTQEDHIAYVTYNDRGKTTDIMRVIFDDKGRETEERSESVNDSENFQVYYEYDDNDRVVSQEQKQSDRIISKINRRFGKEGYAHIVAVRSVNRGMYVDVFENEYYQ